MMERRLFISMPFRAKASFLHWIYQTIQYLWMLYQCPFGLKLHFHKKIMTKITVTLMYQCPFGLKLHFYVLHITASAVDIDVSMLSRAEATFLRRYIFSVSIRPYCVSMPFRAETPFLQIERISVMEAKIEVSMPFRAGAPFLP